MAAEEEKEGVRQRAVADGDDDWCWRHNNRDTIAWISSLREAYCHYYASCPKVPHKIYVRADELNSPLEARR